MIGYRGILLYPLLAPRLRDLGDRKLYSIEAPALYPDLDLLMGGNINTKQITENWDELPMPGARTSLLQVGEGSIIGISTIRNPRGSSFAAIFAPSCEWECIIRVFSVSHSRRN